MSGRATSPNGRNSLKLEDGAVVAIIGGGPAGAFFALELLRRAKASGRRLNVSILERRKSTPPNAQSFSGCWQGCNYCAGGISPRLYDVLQEIGMRLPDEVIQSRINTITIQGFWKNIELEIPKDRQMLSVFRGSRPSAIGTRAQSFDSFVLEQALAEGANLVSAEVTGVARDPEGKPVISYRASGIDKRLEADFCVFACGMNAHTNAIKDPMLSSARALMPGFMPPGIRKTLIFELVVTPEIPGILRHSIFFVEYGSRDLQVEMCSLLPKRNCITVVLIGEAVDKAHTPASVREVMTGFLKLPHIRRLLSPVARFEPACVCGPSMVVGIARKPFGNRFSAIGDLVTSRLYKDGILSAHRTAAALADAALREGIDARSLERGYGPTLRHFRRNNRFARIVFFLHRVFFSSSVLSRVLYQAVITERKTTAAAGRQLENLLWRIASGDDEYEQIFKSMIRPATLRAVLFGGGLITLRNYLTEVAFGLRWEGLGRFTTGVSLERLEEKAQEFGRLVAQANISLPAKPEFERMYTIKIAGSRASILKQLEAFGEGDRQYLRPRGLHVRRVAGLPQTPGCVIRYQILTRKICFHLRLEKVFEEHLAVYRVLDGFARGGVLLFEIETGANDLCLLSIYVAFNFHRGSDTAGKLAWRAFRTLFPSYVHDVLWNHALCQLREMVERDAPEAPEGGNEPPGNCGA